MKANKEIIKIAVVFTCHNRKLKTKECIETLINQRTNYSIALDYYICDDGSTDGTCDIIDSLLPNATLLRGSGNLYWARGMYSAMKEAAKDYHDFYWMVNDDVAFFDDALEKMLNTYYNIAGKIKGQGTNSSAYGIVGSTLKKDLSDISYGGWNYVRKLKIGKSELVKPNGVPQKCDLANWNCFLITNKVIQNIGLIDSFYHHSKGDFDYSMMMMRKGYDIYIAYDYVGTVDNNEPLNLSEYSRIKRLKRLFSVKGTPPKYEYHYFVKNWGVFGFLFFFYSFPKTIIHELLM